MKAPEAMACSSLSCSSRSCGCAGWNLLRLRREQRPWSEMPDEGVGREQGAAWICSKALLPLADQRKASPRHHPHRARALFSQPSRDQRTAALRALHHHQRRGESHDQDDFDGEMAPLDRVLRGAFRDQQSLLRHSFLQSPVMTGIDAIETCSQHGHGRSIGLKTSLVNCGINAFGEPLITGQPERAKAWPSSSAIRMPCGDAERVPTTATA